MDEIGKCYNQMDNAASLNDWKQETERHFDRDISKYGAYSVASSPHSSILRAC